MPDTKDGDTSYEALRDRVKTMPRRPLTDQERADWAYGNTVIENPAITREMAEQAVEQDKAHQE
ncbi:hypothetical protein C2W62_18525 [Candidatus Entotheonella serta]|nr:hypothetical protein C2W62_18525 [Candidatus Entotheonella serta]